MSEPRRLIQFGAGNIGRSFVGQIFARNGWEVVFVDLDSELVERLNDAGSYDLLIKPPEGVEERLTIAGIRAVDGRDTEAVRRELREARYIASSVGASALPAILPPIAEEVQRRGESAARETAPDIILAENMHHGARRVTELLAKLLPPGFPKDRYPGLLECSVGKMVPLIPDALRLREPTTVLAEPYNTLILDAHGWKNGVPDIPQLYPVENITAYVDRKLFIHNLGHAATAYLGYRRDPSQRYLYEQLENRQLREQVRGVMRRSAEALAREYPESFTTAELEEHIDDLIYRFRNRALGDTVHRVGRDLRRKLSAEERVVGALDLVLRHRLDPSPLVAVYTAALEFRAPDEGGELYPGDREFLKILMDSGIDYVVREISGVPPDSRLYAALTTSGGAAGSS